MHVVEKVFAVSLLISAMTKPTTCGEPFVSFPKKIQFISRNVKNTTLQTHFPSANLSLLNIPGASAIARLILGIIN